MEEANNWTTLKVDEVYNNPWIRVEHRDVLTPAGTPGIYGLVHFKNIAVGVIPLDEAQNTWIVGQFRYTLGTYSWEIPEGGGPHKEDPLEAAKRELEEETGILARKWEPFLKLHTSNSVTDEYGIAFVARELSLGTSSPEETEELQVRKLPFKELVKMVMAGEVTDALSIAAVLKLDYLLREGKI